MQMQFCYLNGHWTRKCFKRERDRRKQTSENKRSSLVVTKKVKTKENTETSNNKKLHWFVLHYYHTEYNFLNIFHADPGATDHMSFKENFRKTSENFSKFELVIVAD